MSKLGEHKRVSLTTISTQRSIFNSKEAGFNAVPPILSRFGDFLDTDAVQPNKSSKSANKSVRLELELFETDSSRYPEFNYSKLLYLEKKKAKMLKMKTNTVSTDPFADNDDDVARIAKELEAKYGNSYARGRGRRKKDDFCDIGMGYDESDSFIDNTEAYDEILPEEVETLEGGFYINCGALEFKNLNKKSNTRRTDAIIKMPERSRKRVVSSSSDDSSESSSESSSDNEQEGANNNKISSNNDNEEDDEDEDDDDEDDEEDDNDSDSDSESLDGSDSDSESLDDVDSAKSVNTNDKKKFKQNAVKLPKPSADVKQKGGTKKQSNKPNVATSSSSNSPRPNAIEISDTEERQAQAQALKKVVKTTTVKDMLKAKRDSFLKSQGQVDGPSKSVVNGEVKCTTSTNVESSSEDADTDSASEQGRPDKGPKGKDGNDNLRTADTILPAALDKEILSNINSFKEMVRSRDLCGKRFYFDNKLTALLLKIYEALLCTDRNERNMVFAHLEYQLQLPKYYILRKGKALRAREEKNKTTIALEKLRKAVAEVMPKAIANYEIELHKFAELAAADVNSEHPPKMPRKKFQWNNELREKLYEVYQARWTSYPVLGRRKDTLEQFINGYLKDKLVDLWATGWMRYEELQREIERHKHASKKLKEKSKKMTSSSSAAAAAAVSGSTTTSATTVSSSSTAATVIGAPATTAANNYLKQLDELTATEQSQSRANSDTDSATSASSNSVKRKLDIPANGAVMATVKPPKIKFQQQLAETLAQMSQAAAAAATTGLESMPAVNNYLKQLDDLTVTTQSNSRANSDTDSVASASSSGLKRKLVDKSSGAQSKQVVKPPKKKKPLTQLDTLMTQPSTSAQAAALNAAVVAAAASMLELASPTKQTDHSIYNIMTASTLNSAVVNVSAPIVSQPQSQTLHSTQRPVAHVINLDNYKNPSDILHTSQQLAANKWTTVPPPVVRCESSSESDGVEIVGVFPASAATKLANTASSKSRSKTSQKSKATSVISTTGTVPNGINGALGFNLNNMCSYNNNNNNNNNKNNINAGNKLATGVIRSSVAPTASTAAIGYDLTRGPHILKQLSDLSALEKQMNWSPCSLLSAQGLKGAGTAGSTAGTGTATGAGPGAGAGAGTGAGTTSHQ
ncbi:hypothetical protein ACLKA6_016558 [Drosophila palustris]